MRARLILPMDCTLPVPSRWVDGRATREDGFACVPIKIAVSRSDTSELVALLEYLAEVNAEWCQKHRGTPKLYHSGVTYEREAEGANDYLSWPAMLKRRVADCEDLSAKRMQELREGADPGATFDVYWTGERLIHIRIERSQPIAGQHEDPSRMVGM